MSITGCNKVCLQFTKQSHSSSSGLRNTDVTEIVQISSNGMDVSHYLETKSKLIDIIILFFISRLRYFVPSSPVGVYTTLQLSTMASTYTAATRTTICQIATGRSISTPVNL